MVALNMNGPYSLTANAIDQEVTQTSPGNYALGYLGDDAFVVRYVGRSDSDVNDRLHRWVGVTKRDSQFKFSYASSVKEAFEKECRNYHDFGESENLNNDRHPAAPDGTSWSCPACGQ